MAITTTKIYASTLAEQYASRLDGERLRRIAEAKTVESGLRMLGDYGYFYEHGGTIDGFVVEETNRLIEFITENAADEVVADALTLPFWYNNVKLSYKSRYVEIPPENYYRFQNDASKIADFDYSDCDGVLADTLTDLDAENERKPQNIDIAITCAMYKNLCSCRNRTLRKYFRAEVDMKNILTAARMHRLGIKNDREFIDGGTIDRDTLVEAADGKNFALLFMRTPYEEMADSLEQSDFSELYEFERGADEYLFYMTDSLCRNMSSYEPFLNYYTRARIELKAIKTALVCVKTDARDVFFARMPEIYK